MLQFKAKIKINNINPYVLVSAARIARIKKDWRKPLPVKIRIDSHPEKPWRINLMPVGDGNFYLYLHGSVRKASQTEAGDEVLVEIEFDDDYKAGPTHPMPLWFKKALKASPKARAYWDKLIPSRKKEVLRYLAGLKSPAARERNLSQLMFVLEGGKGRYMARSWNDEP